jgi:hypothetical protein
VVGWFADDCARLETDPAGSSVGRVLELIALAEMNSARHTCEREYIMDFDLSDIIFLVVVLSIAIMAINNNGGGGGRRIPVPTY